jgi:hypothetical protein
MGEVFESQLEVLGKFYFLTGVRLEWRPKPRTLCDAAHMQLTRYQLRTGAILVVKVADYRQSESSSVDLTQPLLNRKGKMTDSQGARARSQ